MYIHPSSTKNNYTMVYLDVLVIIRLLNVIDARVRLLKCLTTQL